MTRGRVRGAWRPWSRVPRCRHSVLLVDLNMSFDTREDAAALRRDVLSAPTGPAKLQQALDLSQFVLDLSVAGAAMRRVTEPDANARSPVAGSDSNQPLKR